MRIMVVMLIAWLTGCATSNPISANGIASAEPILAAHGSAPAQTLNDNSEICLKSDVFQVEMCYGRGEARVDPANGQFIGYEMKLTHINAKAR